MEWAHLFPDLEIEESPPPEFGIEIDTVLGIGIEMMHRRKGVIGGEGNGGIIYPELHYGRDSLVGIALFLSHLAKSGKKCSELKAGYPNYFITKNKIELTPETDVDKILLNIRKQYENRLFQ